MKLTSVLAPAPRDTEDGRSQLVRGVIQAISTGRCLGDPKLRLLRSVHRRHAPLELLEPVEDDMNLRR